MYPIYYISLIKLRLRFYPYDFDILNDKIFITNSKLHRNSSADSVMSSFIDSRAGLVLSIWFVLVLVLNSKNIYNCKANDLGAVSCSYKEWTNRIHTFINKSLT